MVPSALQPHVPPWGGSSPTLILQVTGTGPMWGAQLLSAGGCLGDFCPCSGAVAAGVQLEACPQPDLGLLCSFPEGV